LALGTEIELCVASLASLDTHRSHARHRSAHFYLVAGIILDLMLSSLASWLSLNS
jgi:hypothetical protein